MNKPFKPLGISLKNLEKTHNRPIFSKIVHGSKRNVPKIKLCLLSTPSEDLVFLGLRHALGDQVLGHCLGQLCVEGGFVQFALLRGNHVVEIWLKGLVGLEKQLQNTGLTNTTFPMVLL